MLLSLVACSEGGGEPQPSPTVEPTPTATPEPSKGVDRSEYDIVRLPKGQERIKLDDMEKYKKLRSDLSISYETDIQLLEALKEHMNEDVYYYVRIEYVYFDWNAVARAMRREFYHEGFTVQQYEYMYRAAELCGTEDEQQAACDKYIEAGYAAEKWADIHKYDYPTEGADYYCSREFNRLKSEGFDIVEDSGYGFWSRSAYLTKEQLLLFDGKEERDPSFVDPYVGWRITLENDVDDTVVDFK